MITNSLKVSTPNLSWDIPITGKYTLLQGKSGTGKSTLFNTLHAKSTKTDFFLPVLPVTASTLNAFKGWLAEEPAHLMILDEDSVPVQNKEFQAAMVASHHLFLIITREPLVYLPYGVSNMLELHYTPGRITGTPRYVPQTTNYFGSESNKKP